MNESTTLSESDDLAGEMGNGTKHTVPETHPFVYNADEEVASETGKTEELPPLVIPGVKGIVTGLAAAANKHSKEH